MASRSASSAILRSPLKPNSIWSAQPIAAPLPSACPQGNVNDGLGAGQVTYNINNHFETSFFRFTPDVELGFGDTSNLVEQRVLKSYITVGPMAHFQAGTAVDPAAQT